MYNTIFSINPEFSWMLCWTGGMLYMAYWFLSESTWLRHFALGIVGDSRVDALHFFLRKFSGFLLLGVGPFLICLFRGGDLKIVGIAAIEDMRMTSAWFCALSVFVLFMNFFIARSVQMQQKHPELRYKHWSTWQFLQYIFIWGLYLLGYEFLFRGILFYSIVPITGLFAAIALNSLLYAFAHLPQGIAETFGSAIIGIFLCLATWFTGTIWVACLVHFVLAASGAYFSIRYNSNMVFARD